MSGLDTAELSSLNARIARRMIDTRCFEDARLDPDPADIARGRLHSWLVAVDGVQLRTYPEPGTRNLEPSHSLWLLLFHSVLIFLAGVLW